MSGFVGLLATKGAGVDPFLLQRLTDALSYFAPDGASARTVGRVGLGFAETRIARRLAPVQRTAPTMPASDGRGCWVVADAALYERDRLVRELGTAGVRVDRAVRVPHLILAAYQAWGTRCVEHLHGDFAFAIWDQGRDRLMLARDRFGLRPLYYAAAATTFVFSNSLDVVRLHPGIGATLDDAAVGDFLRSGLNTALETTVFADVRCVPPAHVLTITADQQECRRYWELPTGTSLGFRRVEDYAARFVEVMGDAVADRMAGLDEAAIFLSGGRDSTAVAAMARAVDPEFPLRAVTAVFDYALPDDERAYTAAAAAALRIPVDFVPQDEFGWFEGWDRDDLWRPEPEESPLLAGEADLLARAAQRARVAFTGDGGDAALRERESHLARLLLSGHWLRAALETATYIRWHRRLPRPGFRRLRMRRAHGSLALPPLPPWLRSSLVERTGLQARWEAEAQAEVADLARPLLRPEAFNKLRSPFWARCFESEHAASTGIPLEHRHPFFDERVVEFLLSLPDRQWANDKGVVAIAMRGRLPDRVRLRNKTPLAGDSYASAYDGVRNSFAIDEVFGAEAQEFIDPAELFTVTPHMDTHDLWDWTRGYSLALWLKRRGTGRPGLRGGASSSGIRMEP